MPKVQGSIPEFIPESVVIMNKLKSMSISKIEKLMDVSNELAKVNAVRYKNWDVEVNDKNGRPAMFTYSGEVYRGIGATGFDTADIEFAQQHLRILSGLYGVLRPNDLIQPYRLEMASNIAIGKKKNLYAFWIDSITTAINASLMKSGSDELINLASSEYSKAMDFNKIKGKVITPVFMDLKQGGYKVVNTWSKHARGLMTGFIVRNKINTAEGLKSFDRYQYNSNMSTESTWVFTCDTNTALS